MERTRPGFQAFCLYAGTSKTISAQVVLRRKQLLTSNGATSSIELHIAIIVSCAPALFGFTRTKIFQSSIVKSLLSSLSSLIHPGKVHDPEAGHGDWHESSRTLDNNREPNSDGVRSTGSRTPRDRYYELHDTHEWTQFESEVSAGNAAEHGTPAANGIVAIEQTST